jgi:hypothetical protein
MCRPCTSNIIDAPLFSHRWRSPGGAPLWTTSAAPSHEAEVGRRSSSPRVDRGINWEGPTPPSSTSPPRLPDSDGEWEKQRRESHR